MKSLANKVVVITGAGSGIGRALALKAAAKGARLAISDWNESGLNETVALLKEPGAHEFKADRLDVSDKAAFVAYAEDVAVQPDLKTVVAGPHWNNNSSPTSFDLALFRYDVHGGLEQFVQQRRHGDHLAVLPQALRGFAQHIGTAGAYIAVHVHFVHHAGGNPQRAARRHDPATLRRDRLHHAGGCVQKLVALVRMGRQHEARGIVVAGGDDRAGHVFVAGDAGLAHG